MEKFWNIIHWVAYKVLNKPYMLSTKIAIWSYNTAWGKSLLKKNGRNADIALKELRFAYTDKRFGQSSYWAFGVPFMMPIFFLFGLQNFYLLIFNNGQIPSSFEIFICILLINILITTLLNYYLLLYKDKYLKYFKQFEKQPHKWKVKWAWISLGVILFPFLMLIGSLIVML